MTVLKGSVAMLLLLFSQSILLVSITNVAAVSKDSIQAIADQNGIRVVVGDVELYFNATNGGEITEYFDLTVDPDRNLVNMRWKPWLNLLPLFASLFYKPVYPRPLLSTGGDPNAKLWLISDTDEHVILQSSSRIMSRTGAFAKDAYGNAINVNSTWIVRHNGLITVERTFVVPTYATVPSGWRWYPFYLTREAGFGYNGTFYMFNTTYTDPSVVNRDTYRDKFDLFSLLPEDASHVFGVALPFSNTSLGGDGTHNILVAYKYDELVTVNEWRTDNYHSDRNDITEGGAVYEFSDATTVSTHTYHMMVYFTHQPIDEQSVQDFAKYYADNTVMAHIMETNFTTDKSTYTHGDPYRFYASGLSHYNLNEVTARLTIEDDAGKVIYVKDYRPYNFTEGQSFNSTVLSGTVSGGEGNYTITFQIFSFARIVIASDRTTITVNPS